MAFSTVINSNATYGISEILMACCARHGLTCLFIQSLLALSKSVAGRSGQPLGVIFSSTDGVKGDAYLVEKAKVIITNFCFDGDPECTTFLAGSHGSEGSVMVPYQVQSDRGLRERFQRRRRYLVPKVPALNPDQHVLDWALVETKVPANLTPSEYDFHVVTQSGHYSEKEKDRILTSEASQQRFTDKIMELANSGLSPTRHITVLGSGNGPQHKHLPGKEYSTNNWRQPEELLSFDKADEVVTVLGNGVISDGRKHQKQNGNTPIQGKESFINPKQSSVQKILDSRGKPQTKLPVNKISKKYSLNRMTDATVIVQLSSPAQNWLSIYDHCKEITLAKINISVSDVSLSGPASQRQRNPLRRIIDQSVAVGNVVSLSCNTILLTDFTFVPKEGSSKRFVILKELSNKSETFFALLREC
ncbi:hypothetical protein D918_06866 [Trichuris suis]|nr:hypothetical protein D918_06866 [Trichuris suis]